MRRSTRFLAIALPAALATVPVALAGADPASGGLERPAPLTSQVASTLPDAIEAPPALVVRVEARATVALRTRPKGPMALRIGDSTPFGSRQRLGVVRTHGRWLGVTTPELPNGTLGWVDRRAAAIHVERTRWAIHADVSSRTVVLTRSGRTVKRLRVAVGRAGSSTPTGTYAVTDKLSGGSYGPYYGCCILALSATQPNTPPGWTGGNRMAIHGTDDPSSIGAASSAGCLRAGDGDLAFLMSRVPVGTPVVIGR
ncbi:MAG TPA: L,D-transpeptidase [Thermoleophilaceae bacterium]|nr:L,D-transpeptidase [Thermoleophilaceae bacterium]